MDNNNTKIHTKRLAEIVAELIDYISAHTSELTDYTPGSILRSLIEADGMSLEELYMYSTENTLYAIDHAVLDAFNFKPTEAKSSYGWVTIEMYEPLVKDTTLSQGTAFTSRELNDKSLIFQTINSVLIPAGTDVFKVKVRCTKTGRNTNIPASYLDTISTTQINVATVGNETAFMTGADEQSPEALKQKFRDFVATRGRATLRAVQYAAYTVPEVAGAYAVDDDAPGSFTIYAHDANGDLDTETRNKILDRVDKYRPAGVEWNVRGMNKVLVPLNVNIAVSDFSLVPADFEKNLEDYISEYLNNFKAGDDLVANELANYIFNFSGVITDVQFKGGATYTTQAHEIIRASDVTVQVISNTNFNGKNEIPTDTDDDDTTDVIHIDDADGSEVLDTSYLDDNDDSNDFDYLDDLDYDDDDDDSSNGNEDEEDDN